MKKRAVWWKYSENGNIFEYNPTAALAGTIVKYAEKDSPLYNKGCKIVSEAVNWFIKYAPVERHIIRCFITMYEDCRDAGFVSFDGETLLKKIDETVDRSICRDVSRWWEYIPTLSTFISSRSDRFYNESLEELSRAECGFIKSNQQPDGSFYVPWTWGNDCKEWYVAENWCKAIIANDNLKFLREFDTSE